MATTRDEIYSEVTSQIIADLEGGHIPWERPWSGGGLMIPQNASTQTTYQGINILILWMRQRKAGFQSSQWLTFNQARELGASVKKGEKATKIIYFQPLEIKETSASGDTDTKSIPMLKTHSVFNLAQCDGLESLLNIEQGLKENFSAPEVCEKAERIVARSRAKLSFDGGSLAFYSPANDSIHLPEKTSFRNQLGYYSTVLHELTHWTGAESRLNRALDQRGTAHYAAEELVAELGSSFLCAHVGLEYSSQHAAYIESWLKVLREDRSAIFKAASRARQASEFLIKAAH
jgi:antirestriction protein ArdC